MSERKWWHSPPGFWRMDWSERVWATVFKRQGALHYSVRVYCRHWPGLVGSTFVSHDNYCKTAEDAQEVAEAIGNWLHRTDFKHRVLDAVRRLLRYGPNREAT